MKLSKKIHLMRATQDTERIPRTALLAGQNISRVWRIEPPKKYFGGLNIIRHDMNSLNTFYAYIQLCTSTFFTFDTLWMYLFNWWKSNLEKSLILNEVSGKLKFLVLHWLKHTAKLITYVMSQYKTDCNHTQIVLSYWNMKQKVLAIKKKI